MKNSTFYIKILTIVWLLGQTFNLKSQSPCNSSFVYTINPNGTVTFSSTSLNTNTTTAFNWAVNNVYGTYTGPNPTITFTVNGSYFITLQTTNFSPSCTAQSSQSVIVNNISCNLSAGFSLSQGTSPGVINFNNYSSGTVAGTTYLWNFGDNSANSSAVQPTHTYSANGTYTVTLIANNNFQSACTSTFVQTVQVCNYGTPLNAGFTYSVSNVGNVSFTSTSTGVTASTNYLWKTVALPFNGGSVVTTFSNGVNLNQAVYSYTQNGNYLASLILMDAISSCTAAANQSITITSLTSTLCNLNAFFNVTQGATGATTLINMSSGTLPGTTYLWNFGDGTSSTSFSPVHTYSADGVYMAIMTANNNTTNSCVATYISPIKVCSYTPMVASFVYTSNTGGNVTFTSTSTGTNTSTYYTWYNLGISSSTFASGTNVTQASVTYTAVNGPTNFRLQIIDPNTTCANTVSQTIVISGSCIANAAFSVTPTNTPQVWTIIPFSPINVIAAAWNWGDGSTSNTLYTTHTYSVAGYYSICLSVTLSCGATHSFCNTSYVFKGEQANGVIEVEVINPATVGIKNNSATASELFIAPNPNNGIFTLIFSNLSNEVNISLYDLTGKLIHQQKVQTRANQVVKEFRFTELNNGIYFLKMDSNGKTLTKKIIIEK